MKIIAVICATFAVAKRKPEKLILYIHNFIIFLSRVYNGPIQRPAPSWLVSLIGRALHRYRRGQRVRIPYKPEFLIFRLSFRNCKSCVCNCDDLHSYNSSPCSSHIWFHIFITSNLAFVVQFTYRKWSFKHRGAYFIVPVMNGMMVDEKIQPKPSARNLGVIIDQSLDLTDHVNKVCVSCQYHLRDIAKIRKYSNFSTCVY